MSSRILRQPLKSGPHDLVEMVTNGLGPYTCPTCGFAVLINERFPVLVECDGEAYYVTNDPSKITWIGGKKVPDRVSDEWIDMARCEYQGHPVADALLELLEARLRIAELEAEIAQRNAQRCGTCRNGAETLGPPFDSVGCNENHGWWPKNGYCHSWKVKGLADD